MEKKRKREEEEDTKKKKIQAFLNEFDVVDVLNALHIPDTPTLAFATHCLALNKHQNELSALQSFPVRPKLEDGKVVNEKEIAEYRLRLAHAIKREKEMVASENVTFGDPPTFDKQRENLIKPFEYNYALPLARLKFLAMEFLPSKYIHNKEIAAVWRKAQDAVEEEIRLLKARFEKDSGYCEVGYTLDDVAPVPASAVPEEWKNRRCGVIWLARSMEDNFAQFDNGTIKKKYDLSEVSKAICETSVFKEDDERWIESDEPGVWLASKALDEPPEGEMLASMIYAVKKRIWKKVGLRFLVDCKMNQNGRLRLFLTDECKLFTDMKK